MSVPNLRIQLLPFSTTSLANTVKSTAPLQAFLDAYLKNALTRQIFSEINSRQTGLLKRAAVIRHSKVVAGADIFGTNGGSCA